MGWPKPSHFRGTENKSLEVELHRKFDHAVPLFGRGLSKIRIGLSNDLRGRILLEGQTQVVGTAERPQRMVEEVIHLDSELQLLRLRDLEVLEQRKIRIEVGGTVSDRKQSRAILPRHGRGGEAASVQ